jgi:hypothetical protein
VDVEAMMGKDLISGNSMSWRLGKISDCDFMQVCSFGELK